MMFDAAERISDRQSQLPQQHYDNARCCPPLATRYPVSAPCAAGDAYFKSDRIRFIGDYRAWAEAEHASIGYSVANILEKRRSTMLKVERGTRLMRAIRWFLINSFIHFPYLPACRGPVRRMEGG
jgi:hypothetical protein